MCSILGISFQNGSTFKEPAAIKYLLRGLLTESQRRGTDATGVAFVSTDGITVFKNPISARTFIMEGDFCAECNKQIDHRTISLLGHCRFKTKGSEFDNYNNHPIVTDNIVGVHNGVIDNDEDLFGMFPIKSNGKVDSEVIFSLLDYFIHESKLSIANAVRKVSGLITGSFACAFVDRTKPHLLWIFRNYSPLVLHNYTKCGVIMFASDEIFIESAIGETCKDDLGRPSVLKMDYLTCLCINLVRNSTYSFAISDSSKKRSKAMRFCGVP